MKKIYLSLITLTCTLQFCYAQWTTSGSNIYNSNAGNVGIGTSTPAAKLDVNGVINSNSYSSSSLGFYVNGTADGFNNTVGSGYLAFRSNNVDNRMVIDPNGNIGIGTTNPLNGLNVYSYNNSSAGSIRFSYSGVTDAVMGFGWNGSSQDAFQISIFPHNAVTGSTNLFTILNSGYVGIGTLNPGSKLDVQGGNANVYNTGSASSVGIGSGISGKTMLALGTSADAGGYATVQGISAQGFAWGNVVINSYGGNVLIGKTTQANTGYLLDVAGIVRANQVVINTTGADFVFAPKYHLNSLANVKKYIDKNHHLPEIASAKEMQTNGLNVGENQTKLLQKVEELTLYLIEKDKQLNEQKSKLNDQQIQISDQQKTKHFQQQEIDELKKQMAQLLKRSK